MSSFSTAWTVIGVIIGIIVLSFACYGVYVLVIKFQKNKDAANNIENNFKNILTP